MWPVLREILSQCFELGLIIDHIICASGSGGTQSGLIAGFYGNHAQIPVIGINVVRNKRDQEDSYIVWYERRRVYGHFR